jgi:hypothetical protein
MHCEDEDDEGEPKDTGLGQSKRSVRTVREIGLEECIDGIVDGSIKPVMEAKQRGEKGAREKGDAAGKEEKKKQKRVCDYDLDEYIDGIIDGTIKPIPRATDAKQKPSTEEQKRDAPLHDAKQTEETTPKPKRSIRDYAYDLDAYIDGICDGTIKPLPRATELQPQRKPQTTKNDTLLHDAKQTRRKEATAKEKAET